MTKELPFRALSDPTRRLIFERLSAGAPQRVCDITAVAGISQPAVSKHLAVLRRAGLVSRQTKGREAYYAASAAGLIPIKDWLQRHSTFWSERVEALDDLLKRMDQ